jgi:hypothetical protein
MRDAVPRMTLYTFCRVPDAVQPRRCGASPSFTLLRRAGTVTNAGVWYGPGSAKRHEECGIAPGTLKQLRLLQWFATGFAARLPPCGA